MQQFYIYLIDNTTNLLLEKIPIDYTALYLLGPAHQLPVEPDSEEGVKYRREFKVNSLTKCVSSMQLSVTADNTFANEEYRESLKPLVVDIRNIANIPPKSQFNTQPVHLSLDFFGIFTIITQSFPHQDDIDFDQVHVFFLGILEKDQLSRFIKGVKEEELVVNLFDKNYVQQITVKEDNEVDVMKIIGEKRKDQEAAQESNTAKKDSKKPPEAKKEAKDAKKEVKKEVKASDANSTILFSEEKPDIKTDCNGRGSMDIKDIFNQHNNGYEFQVNFKPVVKFKHEIETQNQDIDLKSIMEKQQKSVNKCE